MTILLIRAAIIYFAVIAAVRIMGKRQLGELSTHEFVITILISAVATMPLEDNAIPLANSLLPILIFISLEILESALSMKSALFRRLIQGRPIFIIKDGILQQKEMKKLRFTVDDVLDSLRQQSVFDISKVENAIVETNGKLSVQLKSEYAPPTAKDTNVSVDKAQTPVAVIVDGKITNDYFGNLNICENEIELLVKSAGKEAQNVMLMTADKSGKVYIIEKENK